MEIVDRFFSDVFTLATSGVKGSVKKFKPYVTHFVTLALYRTGSFAFDRPKTLFQKFIP